MGGRGDQGGGGVGGRVERTRRGGGQGGTKWGVWQEGEGGYHIGTRAGVVE